MSSKRAPSSSSPHLRAAGCQAVALVVACDPFRTGRCAEPVACIVLLRIVLRAMAAIAQEVPKIDGRRLALGPSLSAAPQLWLTGCALMRPRRSFAPEGVSHSCEVVAHVLDEPALVCVFAGAAAWHSRRLARRRPRCGLAELAGLPCGFPEAKTLEGGSRTRSAGDRDMLIGPGLGSVRKPAHSQSET